jgi:endogenous inhibitor of DNA gyrase (YacG/DUF329 family)
MAPYDRDQDAGRRERAPSPRCPICGNAVEARHRPFCSKRCADIDLHRWLAGVYRVPTQEKPEEEDGKPEA